MAANSICQPPIANTLHGCGGRYPVGVSVQELPDQLIEFFGIW